MARFRRSFRRGSGKKVHPTKWCGMNDLVEIGSVSGASVQRTICTVADLEEFSAPTVVRIRGWIHVATGLTDIASTVAHAAGIALGIRTIDEQVIASGDLLTGNVQEADWMWLGYSYLTHELRQELVSNGTTGVLEGHNRNRFSALSFQRYEVDVKAMRRVPQNHALVLAWTWENYSGTNEMHVAAQLRALIKE